MRDIGHLWTHMQVMNQIQKCYSNFISGRNVKVATNHCSDDRHLDMRHLSMS